MVSQKFLPKKAYSIIDAVKYISLNYNINISEYDLLEYIQSGDLQASIHLDGRINKIDRVNKREIPHNKTLNIRNEEIFLQFNQKDTKSKIEHNEDFNIYQIKLNHIYFSIDIILNDCYYLPKYFSENDEIKLYTGELDRFRNLVFNGYFPLSKEVFEPYNTIELMECGYIDEFPDIYVNTFSGLYLHLPICENRTELYLEDVYIIHEDMIEFLKLFSVIDDSYEQQEETQKLKNQIRDKNKQIEELQKQIEKNSKVKKSTASENKKNEFIKALLQIKYGAEVAENPRPHVYDPNDSDKGKDGVIQRDFESKGLTKHLPSGKTLKNWVSSVELDN
ncbi:TPA: SlyX protein [Haemophilus influenzae]|uniref:SlyX protein n=1 Tax=Haemophilus influenzae TaxID=727 RepID=UPI000E0A91B5|nr:SlyX protein [Haemophilus influenzae]NKB85126.1 SlyX protein [Haemophilus influenzae]